MDVDHTTNLANPPCGPLNIFRNLPTFSKIRNDLSAKITIFERFIAGGSNIY